MNTVGRDRRLRIFKLLVEGMGVRSVERAVGVHRDTILRLLVNAGYNLDDFLDMKMRNLRREHWEIDEMWTFCRKKEKRLTPDEKAAGVWGDQVPLPCHRPEDQAHPSLPDRQAERGQRLQIHEGLGRAVPDAPHP